MSFDSRKAGRELVAISGAGKTTQHQHVHQRCSLLPVFLIFKVCVLFFPEYPFDTVPFPKKVEVLEDDCGTVIGYPQNLDDRESVDPDREVGEASFEQRCRMIQVY